MIKILMISVLLMVVDKVAVAGNISITVPNNQTTWVIGGSGIIQWVSTGVTNRMKITLWRGDNTYIGVIADNILPPPPQVTNSTMHFNWNVGYYNGGKAEAGNDYVIKIQEKNRRMLYKSEQYFEIKDIIPKVFPKSKFWDLYLESIVISPNRPLSNYRWSYDDPVHRVVYVDDRPVIWEHDVQDDGSLPYNILTILPIKITAHIRMRTPPKNQITKEDVSKWGGASKSFNVTMSMDKTSWGGKNTFICATKKFTWKDVQNWPDEGKTFGCSYSYSLFWEPPVNFIDSIDRTHRARTFRVNVWIDDENQINEINESNNNNPNAPYIVFMIYGHPPLRIIRSEFTELILGSTQTIKWETYGITKRMKILLYHGDNPVGVIADNIIPPPTSRIPSLMTYKWKVGSLSGGKVAYPGNDYWIMIRVQGEIFQTTQRYTFRMYPKFNW